MKSYRDPLETNESEGQGDPALRAAAAISVSNVEEAHRQAREAAIIPSRNAEEAPREAAAVPASNIEIAHKEAPAGKDKQALEVSPALPAVKVVNRTDSEIAPELHAHITGVFDERQNKLIVRANQAKIALNQALNSIYKKVISPGHSPGLFDPHKARHLIKTEIANKLVVLCSKPITNIEQLKQFTSQISAFKKENLRTDDKGGRLATILSKVDNDALDMDFYTLTRDKKEMVGYLLTILGHIRAMRLEEAFHEEHNKHQPYSGSFAFSYHNTEIIRYLDLLIHLYARELSTITFNGAAEPSLPHPDDTHKDKAIQRMLPVSTISAIIKMREMRQLIEDALFSQKDEQSKLQLLEKCINPYILEYTELYALSEPLSLPHQPTANDRVTEFVNKSILLSIIEILKFAEKPLYWELRIKLEQDINARFAPDLLERKLTWYLESLRETQRSRHEEKSGSALEQFAKWQELELKRIMDEEEFGPRSARPGHRNQKKTTSSYKPAEYLDYTNQLHTRELIRALESLLSDASLLKTDALKDKISKLFEEHVAEHLNPEKYDTEKVLMVQAWRKELTNIRGYLLGMLDQAQRAIITGATPDMSLLVIQAIAKGTSMFMRSAIPAPSESAADAVEEMLPADVHRPSNMK